MGGRGDPRLARLPSYCLCMPDWQTEALPVLLTACRQAEEAERGMDVTSVTIAQELGRDPADERTLRTLAFLKLAGYIEGGLGISQTTGELQMDEIVMEPEGLKYVAGWPGSPEAAAANFLAVLEEAIENASTPEERGRLEKLKDAALSVGTGTMSGLFVRILMGT